MDVNTWISGSSFWLTGYDDSLALEFTKRSAVKRLNEKAKVIQLSPFSSCLYISRRDIFYTSCPNREDTRLLSSAIKRISPPIMVYSEFQFRATEF